jgi:cobalamin-dependent methionine synthase I
VKIVKRNKIEFSKDNIRQLNYETMRKRYHFRQTDLEQLRRLGDEALFAVEPVMYCAPCAMRDGQLREMTELVNQKASAEETADTVSHSSKPRTTVGLETMIQEPVDKEIHCAVIVSLGAGIDALQESYEEKGCLTDAYMIECIAMELLQKTYELAAEALHETYGLWMDGYDFLGERYPIELTEDLFALLAPEGISYNQAYMMTPKKTVVFLTALQKERKNSSCSVCNRCSNVGCPNRQTEHLNYGYQRIFGKP